MNLATIIIIKGQTLNGIKLLAAQENNPNFPKESNVGSSQIPFRENSSKETVELSLEVEIANSLKHLITSPEKHANSPLLDVTIIRPTDIDCVRNSEGICSQTEIKSLIASMEKQKQHKRRLIDICKKQVSSVMNPIIEIQETLGSDGNKHLLVRKNDQTSFIPKRRIGRSENIKCGDNQTGNMNMNYKNADHDIKQAFLDSTSISILKPLVGEIRQSLKHLEAKIVEGGDHHPKDIKTKHKKHYIASVSSTPNFSEDSLRRNRIRPNTHQVYTTANTFEKLRTLLACQNSERDERREQEKERPCLCQHCGMIGLLVDSQKGPVVPTFPLDNPTGPEKDTTGNDFFRIPRRELTKSRQRTNLRTRATDDNTYKTICDLSSRLEALENRMFVQEQNAVPREYFKRIINRILNISQGNNMENKPPSRNNWTQYSLESLDEDGHYFKYRKFEPRVKHKNVQIQQNTRRNYYVNPVLIQTDSEPPSPSVESRTTENGPKRNAEIRETTPVDDFLINLGGEGEGATKNLNFKEDQAKAKESPKNSFWRWGEEIIKPGIDLKTKILALLNEQFQNAKSSTIDSEQTSSKLENSINKTYNSNTTSPINLFDTPKPFEDKEEQTNGIGKFSLPNSSSQALKKVLDFMSEKIYNDHVKPTVDAIKKEQKVLNKGTKKEMYDVKAAMNAAYYRLNNKEAKINRENQTLPNSNDKRYRAIPAELLKSRNNQVPHINPQNLARKSAIPVRVANTPTREFTSTANPKHSDGQRSFIPKLRSPGKDTQPSSPRHDNKFLIGRTNAHQKKNKVDEMDVAKTRNAKNVKITYMNPNAEMWNEESSGSVPVVTSEEAHRVMLTETTSSNRHGNPQPKEEKRRISQNYSIKEKLAILTNIASTEVEKAQLWNKIWNQAKGHCKSKQDTVIIQVPNKRNCNRNVVGVTEVEFTIEDIQKLVNDPKLIQSIENLSQQSSNPGNMESFLLIRSRKILEDVHKRLGNKFLKNA